MSHKPKSKTAPSEKTKTSPSSVPQSPQVNAVEKVTQAPCSVLQNGGTGNSANTNCGPTDLVMSDDNQSKLSKMQGLTGHPVSIEIDNSATGAGTVFIRAFKKSLVGAGMLPTEAEGQFIGGGCRDLVHGLSIVASQDRLIDASIIIAKLSELHVIDKPFLLCNASDGEPTGQLRIRISHP